MQATGRRCFTVSLAQEVQNFDSFCAGIRARGGALDLTLGTDAMMATVWDAGSVPNRPIQRSSRQSDPIMRIFGLVFAVAVLVLVLRLGLVDQS